MDEEIEILQSDGGIKAQTDTASASPSTSENPNKRVIPQKSIICEDDFSLMASKMRKKYEKYSGNPERCENTKRQSTKDASENRSHALFKKHKAAKDNDLHTLKLNSGIDVIELE
ncbi:hypothetical protein ACFE04_012647 [Oxalis oulophora]